MSQNHPPPQHHPYYRASNQSNDEAYDEMASHFTQIESYPTGDSWRTQHDSCSVLHSCHTGIALYWVRDFHPVSLTPTPKARAHNLLSRSSGCYNTYHTVYICLVWYGTIWYHTPYTRTHTKTKESSQREKTALFLVRLFTTTIGFGHSKLFVVK